jgi:hypothetical protein
MAVGTVKRQKATAAQGRVRLEGSKKRSGKLLPVLVGVVVSALGGLTAVWAASRGDAPTSVVMLIRDVTRGQKISSADLSPVALQFDQSLVAIPWEHSDDAIGREVLFDAKAGTVLAPEMLTKVADLPPGMVIVGAVLNPGELPVAGLRTGDRVMVMSSPPANTADAQPEVLVGDAQVWRVAFEEQGTGDSVSGSQGVGRWVSLLVPEDKALLIGSVAEAGQLRLAARG